MEKMGFTEFANWSKNVVEKNFNGFTADVSIVTLPGKMYNGLSMKGRNTKVSAIVNLDSLYLAYADNSMPLEEVEETIITVFTKRASSKSAGNGYNWIWDYSKVKGKLYIRLINAEKNRDLLETVPHHMFTTDLAVTYHILLADTVEELTSTIVTNKMLGMYGVSGEALHADAIASACELFPANTASLSALLGMGESNDNPMMVVTNNGRVHGASVIVYPGLLEQLFRKFGAFFILPSSVHEVIVTPDDGERDARELTDLVKSVNAEMVAPDEWLSDHIYRYDGRYLSRLVL